MQRLIEHYESQTEEQAVAEDEEALWTHPITLCEDAPCQDALA